MKGRINEWKKNKWIRNKRKNEKWRKKAKNNINEWNSKVKRKYEYMNEIMKKDKWMKLMKYWKKEFYNWLKKESTGRNEKTNPLKMNPLNEGKKEFSK